MSNSKEAWFNNMDSLINQKEDEKSSDLKAESLEKDFDRELSMEEEPVSAVHEVVEEEDPYQESDPVSDPLASEVLPTNRTSAKVDVYPDLSNLSVNKIPHRNMVLDGVCTHCAHCGHKLTDSVSIQRGIGPICSKRGYLEDPIDGDEIQAMIDLSKYPELVQFLNDHYKPLGIRGLVNGLVRVASLNRPRGTAQSEGNADLHDACCDSIESLGHKKLATLLREALSIMTIVDSQKYPGHLEVRVLRRYWTRGWSYDLQNQLYGTFYDKKLKSTIIPNVDPNNPKRIAYAKVSTPQNKVTNKRGLWNVMLKHHEGGVAKVNGKAVKLLNK